MYFNRLKIKKDAWRKPDSGFAGLFQDAYKTHQAIWELFSDHQERKRDFLYRIDQEKTGTLIHSVSERKPVDTAGLWMIESKEYAPKIEAGQRVLFSLRVNPIRTKRDENNKQHRHDVVMERKDQLKKMGTPREQWQSLNQLAQEEGCKWLKGRAQKHGFSFDEEKIIVEHYSRHCFYKSKGKNKKRIQLSTLDFNGALTVEDPSLFLETLNKGVGPAKAFGCGLMMVRRI